MNQDIENIIKKNLPEEKTEDNDEDFYIDYQANRGFNQALSQINTSLIADEVLKVVDSGISELTYYYKNKAVDEIEEDVAYIKVEEIINLLDNLSTKENENNESSNI